MGRINHTKPFVVCVKNEGYRASLELRKIYEKKPDENAAKHNLIRVIDESGEDYLYPENLFVSIELSNKIKKAIACAM